MAPTPGMRRLQRLLLHQGEQLGERVRLERLAADQHQRVVVDEDDRREVFLGVERQVLVERDVGRNLQIVQQQRVAVRRRMGDAAGGDGGAAAADVLDDEILLRASPTATWRQHARELVGRPAGRIGHDDGDGAARILLRRARRARRQADRQRPAAMCSDAPHHSLLLV